MSQELMVFYIAYAVGTYFALGLSANLSGIPSYEISFIREDFAKVHPALIPRVVEATARWRVFLRISAVLTVNILALILLHPSEVALDLPSTTLLGLIVVELIVINVVVMFNRRKYRRDIEECNLLVHSDNERIVGCIEDHSPRPFRAGHCVCGGRLITVKLSSGAIPYGVLFLPLTAYGQRPVEETDVPVTVFYQPWHKSDLTRQADCAGAIGVYIGFRRDGDLVSATLEVANQSTSLKGGEQPV